MGEKVPSAGVDAGPLERFEQRSAVSEFGSANRPFGSAPGREELPSETGDVRASDVVSPSELAPEDAGLDRVDFGISEGGGFGDVVMP